MTPFMNLLGSGTISTLAREVLSGDFNGDGKADIWSFEDTGVKIYTFSGSTLSLLYNSTWPSNKHFFTLGDFNADGKTDIFLYGYGRGGTEYDWSEWQIQLSTGIGFTPVYFPKKKNNLKDDLVRLGDFNGDGATDIMVTMKEITWTGTYFYISKNNGTDLYTYNIAGYPVASHNFYVADFDGDAHTDFICTDGEYAWWNGYQVYKTVGNTSILMEKVGNGLGVLTKVNYTKLSQASSGIYQRGSGAAYPVADFQGPLNVVTSVQYDNGKGSLNTQNYYYEGVKIHLQGKGFLGFTKTRISDVASGIDNESVITSGFNTTYFYPNVYLALRKRSNTTDTLEKAKNTMTRIELDVSKKRIFPYVQVSTQTNKLTGQKITVTSSYDNYGNPTSTVKTFLNGPTETTTNLYDNTVSSSQWLLGRPTSTTLQYTGGGNTITRSGSRTFGSSNNNLNSETWHSGTNQQVVKGFKYNPNGTLKRDSITANGSYRTTIYTYESNSIRIKTIKDPLSHTTTFNFDSYGRLQTKSDYLNNTLTYQYDAMGRDTSIVSSEGSRTRTAYGWETPASVPKPARYSVQKTGNDGSQSKSWFDKLGREIRSDVKGFNGTWIYTVKRYNLKGQTDSVSEPYYSNETPLWNRYQYDNYGRITNLTRPSGRNSSWVYNNNIVTETTGGKSFTKTYASDGTLTSAQDAGGTITYTYFPDGKIRTISAPGSIITQMEYDIAGNQKKLIDPSAGTINYTYNGYGELVTQQNARSQTTTFIYNPDGTIKRKETPEGLIKYRYSPNKQLVNVNSYGTVSHTYSYDSKGRVISVVDTIPGTTPLTTSFNYDSYGRMSTITHPSDIIETYNYNGNGYLSSISAGGSTMWTTTSMNARGQVTAGQYGSDLSATYGFDAYGYPTSTVTGTLQSYSYNFNTVTGNLNWRQNNKYTGLKETFNYDNSDRLDNVYQGTGTPVLTLDMAYDSNKGGITTKSDAGTMIYNYPGNPYALGAICPTTGLVPSNTQTLTYTSFESVSTISENNYVASFTYNPEAQRAKMVVQQSGNTILTRWYSGSSYVKETAGGVTKQYTYIVGDAYTAPVVAIKTGTGSPVYYYLLRDYLGSITHVVNTSKTLVAEYSYDAWGRMRNPTNWTNYTPGTEPALFIAGRGFTGHEHLPWFNSINMNGRVYDPLIGQFLSPDNYVQDPTFTQNYNRYTYCLNNPLIYTDPDGEFFFSLFLPIIGPILDAACWGAVINGGVYAASTAITGQKWDWGQFGKSLAVGAISGGVGAGAGMLTQGLNVYGAIPGALVEGGIQGTAGAISGGFTNVIMNGGWGENGKNFWSGAAQGFTTGFILGGISGGVEGYKNAANSKYERSLLFGNLTRNGRQAAFTDYIIEYDLWSAGMSEFDFAASSSVRGSTEFINPITGEDIRSVYDAANNFDKGVISRYHFNLKRMSSLSRIESNVLHEKQHMLDYFTGNANKIFNEYGASALIPNLEIRAHMNVLNLGFFRNYNVARIKHWFNQ